MGLASHTSGFGKARRASPGKQRVVAMYGKLMTSTGAVGLLLAGVLNTYPRMKVTFGTNWLAEPGMAAITRRWPAAPTRLAGWT